MLASEQVEIFLQFLLAVEPPYRGGILLLRRDDLQVIFLHFFYTTDQQGSGFGITTDVEGGVDRSPGELRMCASGGSDETAEGL